MNYEEALTLATRMHKGQVRKNSGLDYITHPIAVADKFYTKQYKIVAVLHDTIEDTELKLSDLVMLGLDKKLVNIINILTKKTGQDYLDYLLLVKSDKIARSVKIEDIKHNLSDLKDGCLRAKYNIALYILEN